MSESKKVLILGYGEMGHAMEYLLTSRHQLYIWDKFPWIYGNFGGGFQYQRTALRTIASLTCLCDKPDKGWMIVGSVTDDNGKPITNVMAEAKDKDIFLTTTSAQRALMQKVNSRSVMGKVILRILFLIKGLIST